MITEMTKRTPMEDLEKTYETVKVLKSVEKAAQELGLSTAGIHARVLRYRRYTGSPTPIAPPPLRLGGDLPMDRALRRQIADLQKRVTKLEQSRNDPPGFVPSSLRVKDGGLLKGKQKQAFRARMVG